GEFGLTPRPHQRLGVEGCHETAGTPGLEKPLDLRQGGGHVDAVHGNSQHGSDHGSDLRRQNVAVVTRPTIAVDANPLTRHTITGTELYSRELCRRLPEAAPDIDFTFYAARP